MTLGKSSAPSRPHTWQPSWLGSSVTGPFLAPAVGPAQGQVVGETLISELEGAWDPQASQSLGQVLVFQGGRLGLIIGLLPHPHPRVHVLPTAHWSISSRAEPYSPSVPGKAQVSVPVLLFLLFLLPVSGWASLPPGSLP